MITGIKIVISVLILVVFIPLCFVFLYRVTSRRCEKGWFVLPVMLCAFLIALSIMPAKPFENLPEPMPIEASEEVTDDTDDEFVSETEETASVASKLATIENIGERETVYVTPTGKKYHRENCSRIKSEKIPMFIEEAIAEGMDACKICYK